MHTQSQDRELERFKTQINLLEYAIAEHGYEVDRSESSRNNVVLRLGNDKISVNRSSTNGHWIYWSTRNDSDGGSIIDFLQNRGGGTLGSVRQRLRPHVSGISISNRASTYIPQLKSSSPDLEQMLKAYHRTESCPLHPYLINKRKIPEETLNHPIFKGRIRKDFRENVIFPHFDSDGLCGYSIKNKGFSGFSANGRRGLWCSHFSKANNRLVIAESAIDALSYFALGKGTKSNFISTEGQPGSLQFELMKRAFTKLLPGSEIVVATDNDNAGTRFYEQVESLFLSLCMMTVTLSRDIPIGKDWNEDLQQHRSK